MFNIGGRTNFIVPEREEYLCGRCGETVAGGRYHNHCPHCLWSRHLDDKVPGDRASECQALMEPTGVIQKAGKWRIIHQCLKCKKKTIVDASPKDNIDLIIKLSHSPTEPLLSNPQPFVSHSPFDVLFVHGSRQRRAGVAHTSTGQAITASVNGWGALRMRKGFQMKATPGDELPIPKSRWELTLPVPFNSASAATEP